VASATGIVLEDTGERMVWERGQSGNPGGRPRGTGKPHGRVLALRLLDKMLEEEDVQVLLGQKFREAFRKNPVVFYERIIAPLLPRDVTLKSNPEEEGGGFKFIFETVSPAKQSTPVKRRVKRRKK